MLEYFYEKDLITFCETTPENWEQAIYKSCEKLIEKEIVTTEYASEIVNCIEKYGPYIVIVPGVAMPHSSEKSKGVLGTAISFTHMPTPVSFEKDNPEKEAQLFFTLAAKDTSEHTKNIAQLSELLMTEGLIEALTEAKSMTDYERIMSQFQQKEVVE